jgi:hypothetical protein
MIYKTLHRKLNIEHHDHNHTFIKLFLIGSNDDHMINTNMNNIKTNKQTKIKVEFIKMSKSGGKLWCS